MAGTAKSAASADQQQETQPPPRSEWVVASIALAIVLGIFGVLAYQTTRIGESAAIEPVGGGYVAQPELRAFGH